MRVNRYLLTLGITLTVLGTSGAQEQKGFIGRTIDKLTAPLIELDPNAVY